TLADAIAKGGSTLRDYVDSDGAAGYFQFHYFVYGREGRPCRACGTAIRSVRLGGRATNFCPKCQR
ncbi:MAG TPA: zinc finger domain-containing protein, partial [Casimicrobiaceae bacterium]|nr:zinc finger domain-containing protein [Casimicrobiaceae bacterium]